MVLLVALLVPRAVHGQVPGRFVNDSSTGCKFWWPNYVYGDVKSFRWNGPCVNGLANGHGSFELVTEGGAPRKRTTEVGEGEASEGRLSGRAFVNGPTWRTEGEFRNGVLNGRGIVASENRYAKTHYEGEFKDGVATGRGTSDDELYDENGGPPVIVHRQADWNGNASKAIVTMRVPGCSAPYRYEGEMHNGGYYDGRGTLQAPDGKTYTGLWSNGVITTEGREIDGSDPNLIRRACRK